MTTHLTMSCGWQQYRYCSHDHDMSVRWLTLCRQWLQCNPLSSVTMSCDSCHHSQTFRKHLFSKGKQSTTIMGMMPDDGYNSEVTTSQEIVYFIHANNQSYLDTFSLSQIPGYQGEVLGYLHFEPKRRSPLCVELPNQDEMLLRQNAHVKLRCKNSPATRWCYQFHLKINGNMK